MITPKRAQRAEEAFAMLERGMTRREIARHFRLSEAMIRQDIRLIELRRGIVHIRPEYAKRNQAIYRLRRTAGWTYELIGLRFRLSRERVRQIVVKEEWRLRRQAAWSRGEASR